MKRGTRGGARPGSGPKPTPVNIERIVALRSQGFSYPEIGKRFDISWQIIRRAHRRHLKEQEGKNNG